MTDSVHSYTVAAQVPGWEQTANQGVWAYCTDYSHPLTVTCKLAVTEIMATALEDGKETGFREF